MQMLKGRRMLGTQMQMLDFKRLLMIIRGCPHNVSWLFGLQAVQGLL